MDTRDPASRPMASPSAITDLKVTLNPPALDFSKREDVERWLADKPRDVAVAFAARAALRVVPLLDTVLRPRGGRVSRVGSRGPFLGRNQFL